MPDLGAVRVGARTVRTSCTWLFVRMPAVACTLAEVLFWFFFCRRRTPPCQDNKPANDAASAYARSHRAPSGGG
eukprot:6706417-Prymnesium_polylepis.2